MDKQIKMLYSKDAKQAYECLKHLEQYSKQDNQIYRYFDEFVNMLDNENSYVRTRGIRLISANAKWDNKNRINEIFDRYLEHIEDEKPITSRQCIRWIREYHKI